MIHSYNDLGRRHKDDLQDPEADVGDGEGFVIADVFATRLLGVALKSRLLVAPGRLHSGTQNQDPKDEEHGQPDLPTRSRIGLDLVQQATQSTPITHRWGVLAGGRRRKRKIELTMSWSQTNF
uniref:Uncharacterized protein n=1 Tax=Oryzias melastigma TaxID=30732 RepID=A0A3B3BZH5_ORYME